ncbi:hypothetical protein [Abyssalbus ytuae]|uniref:Uncharacterized protein n=1 Tax=Abyssalbus ytuae TaxID=2926907 RepID=A0A9E6ZTH8_9FLAO|nr:hypothetical protein [Abyssalbus ytuae]UOB18588.1 hypothetical protein MQE35_04690 [Abyssalbus ytuae]
MAKVITVQGHNGTDLDLRFRALEKLNELPSEVLEKLSKLSESEKAQSYFKNPVLYGTLKAFLK